MKQPAFQWTRAAGCTAVFLAAVACGDSGGNSPPVVPPSAPVPTVAPAIVIRIDTEEFTVGQTATLTATLSGGREQNIEGVWQSSDPEIGLIETTPEGAVLLKGASRFRVETGHSRAEVQPAQGK